MQPAETGAFWVLDGSQNIYQFGASTQPVNTFHAVAGTLTQIAVGTDGSAWGLNASGQIFTYDPPTNAWVQVPGELEQIAVGNSENVWGLTPRKRFTSTPAEAGLGYREA